MVFISTYAKKHYDIKFQKHPKYSLRSAAHGDKWENRARNAVELRRFVEISRERAARSNFNNPSKKKK